MLGSSTTDFLEPELSDRHQLIHTTMSSAKTSVLCSWFGVPHNIHIVHSRRAVMQSAIYTATSAIAPQPVLPHKLHNPSDIHPKIDHTLIDWTLNPTTVDKGIHDRIGCFFCRI